MFGVEPETSSMPGQHAIHYTFFLIEFFFLRNGSRQKKFFKIKKFPHLCWELNPDLWLMMPELYHKTTLASESEGC